MNKQKAFRLFFSVLFIAGAVFFGLNIGRAQASEDYVAGEVIVKYKNSRINLKTASGVSTAKSFNRSVRMQEQATFNETNISILTLSSDQTVAEAILELESDPNVEYAEPNYIRHFTAINTNDVYKDMLWGLDNTGQVVKGASSTADADIDAPEAWVINEGTNASVIVAVIDTGVAYNHPDLINQMWDGTNCKDENGNFLGGCNHGYDFVGDGTITRVGTSSEYITPDEDKTPLPTRMSHGTHVAGTIAAQKNNGVGIIGVAPNVKIMALKTDIPNGSLLSSDIISSVNFARVNGAKVINASFGGWDYSQAEFEAIKLFADAGGIFVAAAGNSGEDNDAAPFYPAGYEVDNIIAVASTNQNDELSLFSQFGLTSVDVAAPGENILSAVAEETYLAETFEDIVPFNLPVGWVASGTGGANWAASSTFTSGGDPDIRLFADKDNPYNNNFDSVITLPTINLSTATSANIVFFSKCDTEEDVDLVNDYAVLEITKNGSDWTEVGRWNETSTTVEWNDYFGDGTYRGYNFDEEIPSEYLTANFGIRFRWHTNESIVSADGCSIDDIQIVGYTDGANNAYDYYNGTSMATPHVAGLVGLIWGYDPYLSPASLKNRILTTGNSLAALATTTVSGKRINAYNALNLSDITPPAKPIITAVAVDNKINYSEKNVINITGVAETNSLVSVTLSDGSHRINGQQQLVGGADVYSITIDGTAATSSALVDGIINVSVSATDATGNVSSAATSSAVQDTVLPTIVSATTMDSDDDGYLEAVKVLFSKDISDASVNSNDFTIQDCHLQTFFGLAYDDIANDENIYITFEDFSQCDSSKTPLVSYGQGTLTDLYGNLMSTTSAFASLDGTYPLVQKLGNDSIDVVLLATSTDLIFSEVLATSSRSTVENALTSGADTTLSYSWLNNTLTVNTTATTTFANDVVANVSDIVGNINEGLLLVDSSLTATQTEPNGSGVATSSSSTPQVVISDPNQAVTITVSSGTTNPTIDVSSFIGSSGTGTIPAINITSANANNVTVAISSSTLVTSASSSWDGIIAAPTVTTVTLPPVSGQTKTLSTAIEIGFTGVKLSFDKAVKILLPGQADKRAGYTRTGTTFTEITTTCGENSQAWADTNLGVDGDCKINSGSDLVIWTKHFTSFATYTQTTNSTGGGGGGGSSFSTCANVVYSEWGNCFGALQYRQVLSKTPANCSLSTSQQLETNRTCELVVSAPTSKATTITNASSTQVAQVISEEKELTTKIDAKLIKRLAGRILLQTEKFGQAWYLDKVSLKRYYLADGPSAYGALRKFGLGIKNSDLDKIPVSLSSALPSDYITSTVKNSALLTNRLKGRIVIQTESRGEAWYINPSDGFRYYLANGEAAYTIMRNLSLGVSDDNIRKITVGDWE